MGNLLAMLLAWLDARSLSGRVVFRMEDLDPARSKKEFANALSDDLHWMGLDWDFGWPDRRYCQSQRTDCYEDAFQTLQSKGLIYPCYCTRAKRLAAANAPHPGEATCDTSCKCAQMTARERLEAECAGMRPAWKLRVPNLSVTVADHHYGAYSRNLSRDCGDFIIRRADGVFAYQLAVSVDDMLMGVNRVVRGRDLLSCAPQQKWLIETLGGTAPVYAHTPLIVSAGGKLSKRAGSLSTQLLRQRFSPNELTGFLASRCGLLPTPQDVSPAELHRLFSWTNIRRDDIEI